MFSSLLSALQKADHIDQFTHDSVLQDIGLYESNNKNIKSVGDIVL